MKIQKYKLILNLIINFRTLQELQQVCLGISLFLSQPLDSQAIQMVSIPLISIMILYIDILDYHRVLFLIQNVGHQYTAFSLATISQALVHEAKQFAAIEEAKHESDLNLQLSAQCTREALNFIRSQAWNGEVEVSVALLYSLRNNPLLHDIQELDQLKSHILKNARYLSTQNIVDVVTSLKDHQDNKFWNEFAQLVSEKEFSWGNTQIDYNGCHTVQYEYTDKPYTHDISNTSSTLSKYEGGSLGGVKKVFLDLYLYGLTSFYWPFVMREKRIKYLFEERQPDREVFRMH